MPPGEKPDLHFRDLLSFQELLPEHFVGQLRFLCAGICLLPDPAEVSFFLLDHPVAERSALFRRLSAEDRPVGLRHLSFPELPGQHRGSILRLRKDHDPGDRLVQALDHSDVRRLRTPRSSDLRRSCPGVPAVPGKVIPDQVHHIFSEASGRLAVHSLRLHRHQDLSVLIEDLQFFHPYCRFLYIISCFHSPARLCTSISRSRCVSFFRCHSRLIASLFEPNSSR